MAAAEEDGAVTSVAAVAEAEEDAEAEAEVAGKSSYRSILRSK